MNRWVTSEILQQSTRDSLANAIAMFIRIGKELLELRNYQGLMNVIAALHSNTIGITFTVISQDIFSLLICQMFPGISIHVMI